MDPETHLIAEGAYATESVRSAEERRAVLAVRTTVFVEEQSVPLEAEIDALDLTATHFLARVVGSDGGPGIVGTARLVDAGGNCAKVGRLAVLPEHRGHGVGSLLMRTVERHARFLGIGILTLDAQCDAIPFYEKLGYRVDGDVFLEAGIRHRRMLKSL